MIVSKIPKIEDIFCVFILLGFCTLHIFLENYLWRKWRKKFSIIYEFISPFLYLIASFILSVLISEYFNL